MKTIIKILGVFFLILLAAIIIIPFVFKDEIKDVVKNATNNSLNAQVDFSDVSLSLLSSFPNLSVNIDDLSIVNYAPFEGDTVFSAKSIKISVDFLSVISGDILKVNSINLDSPRIIMYSLANGDANYNITKEDSLFDAQQKDIDTTKTMFNVSLQSYSINNGQIAFVDQMSNMMIAINNLNHIGKGDFTQDDFILDTETSIDEFTIEMGGIKYLNKVKSKLDMKIGINFPEMLFTLDDNELQLNNLLLSFDGSIGMPSDDIDLDLKFRTPRSEFRDIISLIPTIFKNDFENIKSSGNIELIGNIKGKLTDNTLPAFDIELKIKDGNFQYPDLPTPINNVNAELKIINKTGLVDNTIIDLKNIHLELGTEPIDGKLYLTNLESGPNVETIFKGRIDLSNLKTALDLKDINKLEGIITSDFEAKGNIASTTSNYENINAKGNIQFKDVKYKAGELDEEVIVNSASLNFTPKNIVLQNLSLNIGESDINANGSLNNLISFVLSDGVLVGNLETRSKYFDFNPYLISKESNEQNQDEIETSASAFDIPKKINFRMKSVFDELIYDNLELKTVKGEIIVKESKVTLENLTMNLLQGSLSGNGYYVKNEYQENPDIQFNLNISNFNIKQTYNKFVSVRMFAPIAKYIDGNFSSNLKMNTSLDKTLTPVWETFFSNGRLNLKSAEIKNYKPFTTVGNILNLQELSNPKVQNITPSFEIKNGRFIVEPFKFKVGENDVIFSGSSGIDQSIAYEMEVEIPSSKVKNQANKSISNIIGKDLNLITSNTVKIKALIGGTIDSPNIKTSAGDVAKDIVGDVVEQVKDQIIDEAKAKADSLKAEAEKKIKEEAKKKEEEAKKKLEEEAKKKLKNIFGFG